MIRTERAEGEICSNVNGYAVRSAVRVRTYKHNQAQGRKGKGNRLARVQAQLENIEGAIQVQAQRFEASEKRKAQKEKRKAKRQARRAK